VLALLLAAEAVYLLFTRNVATAGIPQPVESFGSPQAIGTALFNEYLLPFEITSVLLVVAMLGAIVLTKTRKGEG
jgi:NADH-quinone oxidoreductase subunit J